jgi:fimbrial chaperone protein
MRAWSIVAVLLFAAAAAKAASLNVAPILLDVTAPGAATTLTLRNHQDRALDVQIRVFRWQQVDGENRFTPTQDVVVSPPMTTLAPGTDYVVRVVRVSKQPVVGEESYRVIVDELPDPTRRRNGTVAVVLRYSIPVFFVAPDAQEAKVGWSVERRGGSLLVGATNTGGRRLRIASLAIKDAKGKTLTALQGLAGYVLGGATMQWPVGAASAATASRVASVEAESETGPIHAIIAPRPAR